MSWKHRAIIRILLFIARMLGEDLPSEVLRELETLITHIQVWKGRDDEK